MAKGKTSKEEKRVGTSYKSSTSPSVDEDVITIELQSLLTPIAIIIAAIIISVALLYGLKDSNVSSDADKDSGSDTTNEVVINDDNAVAPAGTDENGLTYMTANIDDDAIKGNIKTAKVAIVEFSDYQCPYCIQYYTDVYGELVKNYVDTGEVVIVYRDLPWLEAHPYSEMSANAANCAREQKGDDGYYKYHDALLTSSITGVDSLYAIAADQGLNEDDFKTCVDEEKYMDEVYADRSDAGVIGISGTPGFVIGLIDEDGNVTGVNIGGLASYSTYSSVIDQYLAKAE